MIGMKPVENKNVIEVRGLRKRFGHLEVLKGIDFCLSRGQAAAIIGPSGSGKSTLLRCLAELERAEAGDIIIEGDCLCQNGTYPSNAEIASIRRKMGMVFQHFNLFPHLNVVGNLLCAPKTAKLAPLPVLTERCHALLEKVGLADKAKEMPSKLSGGQKQRVAIARALMMNPDFLLFDEPTSALDPELTQEVLEVIRALAQDNMTMVIVTHEIGFARNAANHVIFMDNGIIVEEGEPAAVIDSPKAERTKLFLQNVYKS